MKILSTSLVLSSVALLLSGCQTTPVVHSTTVPHTTNHWGYTAPDIIPERWGDEEVNKLCQIGNAQSPIDIPRTTFGVSPQKLTPQYRPQDFTISNNGHTIVYTAKNPDTSHLLVNNVDYKLLQFHYHIPSEHTVMATSYPLEIHFVHQNADKQLAVVGVLATVGDTNPNIQKILTNLPTKTDQTSDLLQLDVSSLIPAKSPTYTYSGSLTTPPCSEQVQWLLKAEPITLSPAQLTVLSSLYQGNNRPVMPQGSRVVNIIN